MTCLERLKSTVASEYNLYAEITYMEMKGGIVDATKVLGNEENDV